MAFRSSSTGILAGYACALGATMIWSGNLVVARGLSAEIGPATLSLCRWSIAAAAILPFACSALKRQRREIRANIRYLFLVAFLGVTVFNTMIYTAGHSTTAVRMALIAVFSPVWIVLMARIFLADPLTRVRIAGLVLAASGVAALSLGGQPPEALGTGLNAGDIVMLAATLVFAAYTILVRRKPEELEPVTLLSASFTLGVLMLVPLAALELSLAPPPRFNAGVIGAILYIGLGASLLSYFLWNRAVAVIGPSNAGAVYYSLPLFSGLEAWLLLGENIGPVHVLSGVLIVSGIFMATRQPPPVQPAAGLSRSVAVCPGRKKSGMRGSADE